MSKEKIQRSVDVNLIKSAQEGNTDSFETLYKDYYKYVYYICFEYFRNDSQAEDMTQETFIKVYRNISKLSTPETFNVWISRIAYNCCHSAYRKGNRDAIENAVQSDDENFIENVPPGEKNPNYTSLLEIERAKEVIVDTLEKMKPEIRVIGYLYFFEQLSYKEITGITGKSMGTVSSCIKRMKEKLRLELKKNHISKECCMSILLVPNIISLYQEFVSAVEVPANTNFTITDMSSNSLPLKTNPFHHLPQITLALLSVVIPITLFVYKNQLPKQDNSVSLAKIEEVKYDEALTNKSIIVDVVTTTSTYDKILIDGKEELLIDKNGKYTISLIYKEEIIDSKEITIKNIDKESPTIKKTETKETVILIFEDENEINYDSLKVYINDKEFNQYIFNETNKNLILQKNIDKDITISIQDIVGNQLDANVDFYEILN